MKNKTYKISKALNDSLKDLLAGADKFYTSEIERKRKLMKTKITIR